MDALRIYLLAGLILHKLVWEALKQRSEAAKKSTPSLRFVRAVKIAIFAGVLIQTLLPDVLPIAKDAQVLRMAGAAIYTLGLATAITARIQLGRNWSDIEAGAILPDHQVVARGLYAYIRHPIYTGDLLLLFGLELALNSWLLAGVVLLAPAVIRQALREEEKLRSSLAGYEAYCARTRRFIPFLI